MGVSEAHSNLFLVVGQLVKEFVVLCLFKRFLVLLYCKMIREELKSEFGVYSLVNSFVKKMMKKQKKMKIERKKKTAKKRKKEKEEKKKDSDLGWLV